MQGQARARRCVMHFLAVGLCAGTLAAADWTRFRGPNGTGKSVDDQPVPTTWSATQNVKWKVALPGPGSSSPIIAGQRVFVTCWTGYGTGRDSSSNPEDLRRHLVCLDRRTGEVLWTATVEPDLPEDRYGGMFAQHGFASHTPVTDGERVYAYFGKSGAVAFDMQGKQLWQTKVGAELDPHGWGSASSPILYENLLIVTASAESEALVALDKTTGKQVWRQEASGLNGTWGTPVLVTVNPGRIDLVIGVPGEVWGFDPQTGKLRWYCEVAPSEQYCASVVAGEGVVYAMEARGGGSTAIRVGGEGDVTRSHIIWKGKDSNRISSPILHDGRIYLVSSRVVHCLRASTGERIFQGRLSAGENDAATANTPAPPRGPAGRGGPGGGAFGGRGGPGGGSLEYASPILAQGRLYVTARSGEVYVLAASDKLEQLAVNRVTTDSEDFSATPAVSDGELFLRSSRHLYCIAEK